MLVLDEKERIALSCLAEAVVEIREYADFERLLRTQVRTLFPYEMLGCGAGYTRDGQNFVLYCAIAIDLPVGYIREMVSPDGTMSSPLLAHWFEVQRPQLIQPACMPVPPQATPEWLDKLRRYGIDNIAAHGCRDLSGPAVTYFSFNNMPGELNERHGKLLELCVPMLHSVLVRLIPQVPKLSLPQPAGLMDRLTPRERELVSHLREGRSNKEIALAQGVSSNTVRNQLLRVYEKLAVENRTQAVSVLSGESPAFVPVPDAVVPERAIRA